MSRPPTKDAWGRGVSGLLSCALVLVLAVSGEVAAEEPFVALSLIRPARPMPATDFAAPGLDSAPVRLREFKGKVVVFLNFWATWCPPCREEMPSMERLYRRYKPRGFTILAISIDAEGSEEAVRQFVKSLGLTFPVGLDSKMEVASRYRMTALPTSVLINRQGEIAAFAVGPRDWDSPVAHQVIDRLISER